MTASSLATRRILVTGADGFLGRGVVAALAREGVHTLVAADVREVPAERRGVSAVPGRRATACIPPAPPGRCGAPRSCPSSCLTTGSQHLWPLTTC